MSPWEELGIAPTGDARLIRKAYAARLKRTRPEDDPAGFTRLRAAYEAALAMAPRIAEREAGPEQKKNAAEEPAADRIPAPEAGAKRAPTADDALKEEPVVNPESTGEQALEDEPAAEREPERHPVSDTIPDSPKVQIRRAVSSEIPRSEPISSEKTTATIQGVVAALDRGDGEKAAQLLHLASAKHLLPLRIEFGLKDRLASLLLADRKSPVEQLLTIARQFGWHDEADALRNGSNTPQSRLCARIDLELAVKRTQERKPPVKRKSKRSGLRFLWLTVVLLSALGHGLAACSTLPLLVRTTIPDRPAIAPS